MSASAIAAMAANPAANNNASLTLDSNSKPNARRRTVLVVEKKSRPYKLTEGGVNEVSEDKMIVNEKDLSQRSKDLSQLKKVLTASSTISRRHKRAIPKPQKAKWQTVPSILLLVAFLWQGQMVWRLADRIGDNTNSPFLALDSEIEASLKKMANKLQVQIEDVNQKIANMLQVQMKDVDEKIANKLQVHMEAIDQKISNKLQVHMEAVVQKIANKLQVQIKTVDQKIGNELEIMARELRKEIKEKGAMLDKELKKLEVKTDDNLDKYLTEFKDLGMLSKEEFKIFSDELTRKPDGSDRVVLLDQIMSLTRDHLKKDFEKFAGDGLRRFDFAVASGGAKVVSHSEPIAGQGIFGKVNSWIRAAIVGNKVHPSAQKMLEPTYAPGHCFPLQGSSGFVEIRLRKAIIPEAVTLEHIAKWVNYDRTSAPKDCRVSAWFQSDGDDPSRQAKVHSEFSYDLEKSNAQTFNFFNFETARELGVVVNTVRLDFTSNHGNSALTCMYRFRVHGYEPSSLEEISI